MRFIKIVSIVTLAFVIILLIPFVNPLLVGFLIGYLLLPLNNKLGRALKNKNLASAITMAFSVSLLLAVSYLFLRVLIASFMRVQSLFDANIVFLNSLVTSLSTNVVLQTTSTNIIDLIYSLVTGAPKTIIDFFILCVVIFYTLKDFDILKRYVVSNLKGRNTAQFEAFSKRAEHLVKSFIYGHLFVGFFLSVVVFAALQALSVPYAVELSFLSFIIGVLPIVSPWMLTVAISIYYFYLGSYGVAIALTLLSAALFALNYYLKKLLHAENDINHALLILGLLGGVSVLGIYGFIAGPILFIIVQAFVEKFYAV